MRPESQMGEMVLFVLLLLLAAAPGLTQARAVSARSGEKWPLQGGAGAAPGRQSPCFALQTLCPFYTLVPAPLPRFPLSPLTH